jgi:putative ABC transport system permease protein
MFLVMSGAGLAAMLLRLAVDRRASDAGIMLACGCDPRRVSRALFAEGALLTTLGVLVGVPLGVLYANGMIAALGSWWRGAFGSTPALWLHVGPSSLAVGGICGLAVGLVVAALGVRRLRRRRVVDLLGGWQAMAVMPEPGRAWPAMVVLCASLVAAAVLGALALLTGSVPPEGAFFGIGAALLVAGLAAAALALRRLRRRGGASRSLARLSLRNAGAAGGRSLLTIGLLASATFTVVATATNARDFSAIDVADKQSGTGGFALQAVSSVPLPFDLGTPAGRAHLGFAAEDEAVLEGVEVVSFLASRGEDVSCLNLARPSSPRVLGVPPAMIRRGGFSVIHKGGSGGAPPWALLEQTDPSGAVPAFGDAASVKWTLHSGLGKVYTIPAGDLRFVGLLPGSIFARELLVSEASFRRLFPSVTAPSYFLIATPPGKEQAVAEVLRRNLGDLGLQVHTTRQVLNEFIRVQNTYLSMFLALGGLGLLLGTVGLGATLVRSALERRRELALMTAVGYSTGMVGRVLLMENGSLLVLGLLWGTVSALVAVAPHLLSAGSQVNWGALVGVLAAVLVVGWGTCLVAVRAVVGAELVPALRRE